MISKINANGWEILQLVWDINAIGVGKLMQLVKNKCNKREKNVIGVEIQLVNNECMVGNLAFGVGNECN